MKTRKIKTTLVAAMLLVVTISVTARAAESVETIAKATIERSLEQMETFRGKAIMMPESMFHLAALRWAEMSGDKATIERIKSLYLAAYRENEYQTAAHTGLNKLTYDDLDSQVTAAVAMELYHATGDAAVLKRARMVVEGQRFNPTKEGLYRAGRGWPNDNFIIGAVQAGGYLTFGESEQAGLDFAAGNLEANKTTRKRNVADPAVTASMPADVYEMFRGLGVVEVLRTMPVDHPRRAEMIKLLSAFMKNTPRPKLQSVEEAYLKDRGTGISAQGVFELGAWVYCAAEAISRGWIKDEALKKDAQAGWAGIAGAFKMEYKRTTFDVVWLPYYEWAGVMFAAVGVTDMEKGAQKVKATAYVNEPSKLAADKAVSLWAAMKAAVLAGDTAALEKMRVAWRNGADGKLEPEQMTMATALVEFGVAQWTGDDSRLVAGDWVLKKLLCGGSVGSDDTSFDSLVLAQAFRANGREDYLEKAVALLAKSSGANKGYAQLASALLAEGTSVTHLKRAKILKAAMSALAMGGNGKEFCFAVGSGLRKGWLKPSEWESKLSAPAAAPAFGDASAWEINGLDMLAVASALLWKQANAAQPTTVGNLAAIETMDAAKAKSALAALDAKLAEAAVMLETGALLARCIETGDTSVIESGATRMKALRDLLQTPSGWFRQTENGAETAQASGQCALGMALFARALPAEHPMRTYFAAALHKWSYAIERNYDNNSLWHAVPADFCSLPDCGGTSLLTAALAVSLEEVFIERLEFREMLKQTVEALRKIDKQGNTLSCVFLPLGNTGALAAERAVVVKGTTKDVGLPFALACAEHYWKSPAVSAPEDLKRDMGPLFSGTSFPSESLTGRMFVNVAGKLPDGRLLVHFASDPLRIDPWSLQRGNKKPTNPGPMKPNKNTPDNIMKLYHYDYAKGIQSFKFGPIPMGGISVWIQENPSIRTVTYDMGYANLTAAYIVVPSDTKVDPRRGLTLCLQAPGEKALVGKGCRSLSGLLDGTEAIKDPSGLPAGPGDYCEGYLFAENLLYEVRKERADLQKMLSNPPKPVVLSGNRLLTPVYLRGKVTSALDGKPAAEVSLWLKRNPIVLARVDANGEYEMMFRDAVLYEQDADSVILSSPYFESKEIPLKSYLNDKLDIQLKPLKALEIVSGYVPQVKIPAGYYRMGKGYPFSTQREKSYGDVAYGNCWPVQTVYLPSYYLTQYFNNPVYEDDLVAWANRNGYNFAKRYFPLVCNAMSERDGLTPCYYTADKRVIRNEDDVSTYLTCNWLADGYRIPTFAEYFYAMRSGRTTGMCYGEKGERSNDYIVPTPSWAREFEPNNLYHTSGNTQFSRNAIRLPLDWGMYDALYGLGHWELAWNFGTFWKADDHYAPIGMNLREARFAVRYALGGERPIPRYRSNSFVNYDNSYWIDDWPANPKGFTAYMFSHEIDNMCFVLLNKTDGIFMGSPYRFVRRADGVCNDLSLLKPLPDPTVHLPKPVALEMVGADIEMCPVPSGTFAMGADATNGKIPYSYHPYGSTCAGPEHSVEVSAFAMSRFETTVQQWNAVRQWAVQNGFSDLPEGKPGKSSDKDPRQPVAGVTWHDIVKWCNAASQRAGKKPCYYADAGKTEVYKTGTVAEPVCDWTADGYRLPTEAEWEWAALGGQDLTWFWGEHWTTRYGWTGERGKKGAAHPVGQTIGNQFGLYDMIGNVWEWCWDWAGPYAMTKDAIKDPHGPQTQDSVSQYILTNKLGKPGVKVKPWVGGWHPDHVGRAIRGAGYDQLIGQSGWAGTWDRANHPPDKVDIHIGFRVAASK